MTLLPIVERELVVAARRPITHRTRLTVAVLGIGIAFVVLVFGTTFGGPAQVGRDIFKTLALGSFIFALGSGIFMSADAVSLERREGTLGLLFLTELSGFDVVTGKFLACGLNAIFGLMAVLPIMATAWFMGGVSGGEFIRMALVLFSTLLLSLATGLFVSVRAREEIQAIARTAALLAALVLVPFVLMYLNGFIQWTPLIYLLGGWSPVTAYLAGSDIKYPTSAPLFWVSILNLQLAATALFFASGFRLARSWRNTEADLPTANASSTATRRNAPGAKRHPVHLDSNPVSSLVQSDPRVERFAWISVGIGILLNIAWSAAGPRSASGAFGWILGIQMVWLPIKVLIAWKTCAFFAAARRDGTLELLLTTPLSDFEIVQGQIQGLRRLFKKPVLTLFLGTNFIQLIWVAYTSPAPTLLSLSALEAAQCAMMAFAALTLFVDLSAMAWVGLWESLSSQRPGVAFSWTVLRVVILPAIIVCIPNLVLNGLQVGWARDKFRMNLRAILQGARNPFPVY